MFAASRSRMTPMCGIAGYLAGCLSWCFIGRLCGWLFHWVSEIVMTHCSTCVFDGVWCMMVLLGEELVIQRWTRLGFCVGVICENSQTMGMMGCGNAVVRTTLLSESYFRTSSFLAFTFFSLRSPVSSSFLPMINSRTNSNLNPTRSLQGETSQD